MSTDLKSSSKADQILNQLDSATASLPVNQLLAELQVVIERLGFTSLHNSKQQHSTETLAELDLLFEGEVSDGMLSFVHWLAESDMLRLLVDDTGRIFLNHCIKRYSQITEIKFITPVQLSTTTKQYTSERLRSLYPPPARIIYEVMPSLSAGFVIQDGTRTVDRSFRSNMIQSIKPYMEKQFRASAVRHE